MFGVVQSHLSCLGGSIGLSGGFESFVRGWTRVGACRKVERESESS